MNDAIKSNEIEVTKRTIYAFGKRKAFAYDARGTLRGIAYNITATSKQEAIRQAKIEISYLLNAGTFSAGGCAVRAIGFESWEFALPGRCVMTFGAIDLNAAIETAARSYNDHPETAEFVRAAGARAA